MVSEADRARLEALEKRIAEAKKAVDPPRSAEGDKYSQAQLAWRMVIELVAGLAIGFGIGYGLDTLLGTMPIFLVQTSALPNWRGPSCSRPTSVVPAFIKPACGPLIYAAPT